MILWAWRKLQTLSLLQHMVTVFTVLLPVLPISLFNLSGVCILLIYAGWSPVAVLLIASAHKQQWERAEWSVDEKIEEVSGRLQQLKEEHSGRMTGLKGEIDELERAMRSAFEGIGVSLPSRRVLLRGSAVLPGVQGSATLSVRGGRRWSLLWRWVKRQLRRILVLVWGE